jgi:hypothetical protein
MAKKLKHHPGQQKTHVSLSFTAPFELEEPMNRAAAARGMNRSQYICWLVRQDLHFYSHAMPSPVQTPEAPPRIRRKPSS